MKPDLNAKTPVSAVVLTYNEELNIERCLESLSGWAGEIFIVDSFSTDATCDIARRYTDKIYQHCYYGHPQQWSWALDQLPFSHPWVFAVDADFVVTAALWGGIREALAASDPAINGYYVRHRQIFRGRFIRHGTIYPRYWLRLFRRQNVQVDPNDLVDIHFYVEGRVGTIEYDLIEDNVKDRSIKFWMDKQIRFAQRQAREELDRRGRTAAVLIRPALFGTADQRTLWLKEVWFRLPLYVRPVLLFLYRYILRLGFLDGKQGFLYHATQALIYRLLVDACIDELRQHGRVPISEQQRDIQPAARAAGSEPATTVAVAPSAGDWTDGPEKPGLV